MAKRADIAAHAETAAYLESYLALDRNIRTDRDRLGTSIRRRQSASPIPDAVPSAPEPATSAPLPMRASLRLEGVARVATKPALQASADVPAGAAVDASAVQRTEASVARRSSEAIKAGESPIKPARFNPYGRVIKCELVFTIDSTNEQTPLIALVVEPVYNNGVLVIPAGAEIHGTTRPDRLRDRIFSGEEWVLVFPREHNRPNGRQLSVRGVALDRVEPDANGMTWGITDGSLGLEGTVIRSLQQEEIKRFAATFLASAGMAMQERETDRSGQRTTRNTPQNAVLQGFSANMQRIADEITAEIEKHGVFIRVPAGHQFYFYPTQTIDPDVADISTDIAPVQ